jgi:hypothetical protein
VSPAAILQSLKFLCVAATIFATFFAGWTAKTWKDSSQRLAEVTLASEVKEAFHAHEQFVAETLDAKLAKLRANERIIERHYEKVIENPVYRNVCLDDAGLRLIEAARTGAAPASAPTPNVP